MISGLLVLWGDRGGKALGSAHSPAQVKLVLVAKMLQDALQALECCARLSQGCQLQQQLCRIAACIRSKRTATRLRGATSKSCGVQTSQDAYKICFH